MSKVGLAGEMRVDTGIDTVMFTSFGVMDHGQEGLHVRELFQKAKELKQKEADRVIGMASFGRVSRSGQGADKRKIDQRGNETSQAADDQT